LEVITTKYEIEEHEPKVHNYNICIMQFKDCNCYAIAGHHGRIFKYEKRIIIQQVGYDKGIFWMNYKGELFSILTMTTLACSEAEA